MLRLAFIVSHPIQYYAPLYRRLAARDDMEIKVFFTWHGGGKAVDRGFQREVAWDIPLTDGYPSEVVPNIARDPGTHHFRGLRNPELVSRVLAWKPDAVHLTGYAYESHLHALRALSRTPSSVVRSGPSDSLTSALRPLSSASSRGLSSVVRGPFNRLPILFRGDSHLLNKPSGPRWWIKRAALRCVFRWPAGFLCVGSANRAYYEAFGVPASKLFHCPHSIDLNRFAEPHAELEAQASAWRRELGIAEDRIVLLFAAKFEPIKRPLELMEAVDRLADPRVVLVMVGDGVLGDAVRERAAKSPERFRVLPFQNQSRMPVVYRLGRLFILPSVSETWGLAVNEAMACGRPVLVSDKVGCAADVIASGKNGAVFPSGDWDGFTRALRDLIRSPSALTSLGKQACEDARKFDIPVTAATLIDAVRTVTAGQPDR